MDCRLLKPMTIYACSDTSKDSYQQYVTNVSLKDDQAKSCIMLSAMEREENLKFPASLSYTRGRRKRTSNNNNYYTGGLEKSDVLTGMIRTF